MGLLPAARQGVKADRMVRRFVADALGVHEHEVPQRAAHTLTTDIAAQLGAATSQLDDAIWLHRSGNKPT